VQISATHNTITVEWKLPVGYIDDIAVKLYNSRDINNTLQQVCEIIYNKIVLVKNTGVVRNLDWRRGKMKKICDVILVTFFGDIMTMTSLKWRHN